MRAFSIVLVLSLLVPAAAHAAKRIPAAKASAAPGGMVTLPAGKYRSLYSTGKTDRVAVASFAMDREPVTRGEFLEFVRRYPEWRRSALKGSAADKGYLRDWGGDLAPGTAADMRRPVTSVSRSVAIAYCTSKGKRLPTVSEWEYAAAASETKTDASRDRGFISRLIGFYTSRSSARPPLVGKGPPNIYGVRDLHELAWELTDDPRAAHASHSHEHHMFCASSAIGAADPSNYPAFMRYAVRSGLDSRTTLNTLGFRCAAG
jgi:formylglycine-generating enzyme required for sulfatase activity